MVRYVLQELCDLIVASTLVVRQVVDYSVRAVNVGTAKFLRTGKSDYENHRTAPSL